MTIIKKIALVGYREWAFDIFDNIIRKYNGFDGINLDKTFVKIESIITSKNDMKKKCDCEECWGKAHFIPLGDPQEDLFDVLQIRRPDIVVFVGWSWMVPPEIWNNWECWCVHPGMLPHYRGGSPIQHQMLEGQHTGLATIFRMNGEIDGGPILMTNSFYLDGTLDEAFASLCDSVKMMLGPMLERATEIEEPMRGMPQGDLSDVPIFKRRTPEQSEITLEEITSRPAKYLYNKVRALYSKNENYPTAYIKCADGTKLYIQKVGLEDDDK